MEQSRRKIPILLVCFLVTPVVLGAQSPELIPMWNESDESNTETIDHGDWQNILDAYLISDHPTGVSRFNYAALKENAEDLKMLRTYLIALTSIDPRTYAKKEQFAYWVNLYNALTVHVVTGRFPVDSIKDIKSGLIDFGPWNKELVTIAGEKVTLNHIEHGVLRPIWRDPRIHYAVNCASIGCPNLCPEAYTSENSERLLEESARIYINHTRGASINDDELTVSSIYDWFKEDFGGNDAGVLAHLKKYASPELAKKMEGFSDFDDYYDWALNAP